MGSSSLITIEELILQRKRSLNRLIEIIIDQAD